MKIFCLLILMFILSGCVARSQLMQSWVGKTEDELVSRAGVPDNTFVMSDGKKVLTWKSVWSDGAVVGTCVRSYIVDQNSIVEKWSYDGCSNYFLKLP